MSFWSDSKSRSNPHLKGHAAFGDRLRVHHASEVVGMDEAVASAMRNKKDSSMRVVADLVKDGVADAAISAGNTGALMAISRFVLKTLPGIDRPAIATILPNAKGKTYMLDLGANVDCSRSILLQFGIMGAMLVSALEHKENPSVGLLNIGEEDIKGNEVVKQRRRIAARKQSQFLRQCRRQRHLQGHDRCRGLRRFCRQCRAQGLGRPGSDDYWRPARVIQAQYIYQAGSSCRDAGSERLQKAF